MGNYTVRFNKVSDVAEATAAIYVEKPADFRFKAGQFINLTLLDPPESDAEGNSRTFTLASAPYESDLMVATRMRDTAFKHVIMKISPGSLGKLDGPYGDFILSANVTRPAVFLAGGIGITPFRSIILDTTKNQSPRRVFLFYSNHRPEDVAFLEDLERAQQENPNFKFVPTITRAEKSPRAWNGARGRIDRKMLEQTIGNLSGPIYYIAGPPGMVAAMRKTLNDAGAGDDDIRTEEFDGYP